jgi:hypothetical protein
MIPDIVIETDTHIVYPNTGKIFNKYRQRFTGYKDKKGYFVFGLDGKSYKNHRYIYEMYHSVKLKKDEFINHKNHIRNDNRIDNLEVVTNQQNSQYQLKQQGTSSQYKGVCWYKANCKWQAQIMIDGKYKYLGRFNNEIDAAKAYNNEAKYLNENYDCKYTLNDIA